MKLSGLMSIWCCLLCGSRLSVGQVSRYVDWGTSCDLALDVARKVECGAHLAVKK